MWIENVAAVDVAQGNHKHDANTMLIQIADTVSPWWPTPAREFEQVHRFQFLDIEDRDEGVAEHGITDEQAQELVQILQRAYDTNTNVVVHCTAGICRSGAVAEVGVMLGFEDTGRFRNPNLRVKHKMMQCLGWTYKNS